MNRAQRWHTFPRGALPPATVDLSRVLAYHAHACDGGTLLVFEHNARLWVSSTPDEVAVALQPQAAQTTRDAVTEQMVALTQSERAYIISGFCRCGSTDLRCQCENDE
jgi:hypothetical protein